MSGRSSRRSTSGGLARWTLSSGAGVRAGSPPSSALGSSRWPVPVPTHSASPRRAGRCDVWRATCASSRSSRSRRRTWGESSRRPACRFSARGRGRPARIAITRPRPRGCWRSTPPSPRTPSSSRSIRWARSACVRPPVRAGRHASCLNVNARPTPARTARATSSVPTTCTPTACAYGCAHGAAAATTSRFSSRSAAAIRGAFGCTGSRTTSARTGHRTSAPTPMPTTSSSCRHRPTPATSTASSVTSCLSASSSSRTPTTSTGTPSHSRSRATSPTATARTATNASSCAGGSCPTS